MSQHKNMLCHIISWNFMSQHVVCHDYHGIHSWCDIFMTDTIDTSLSIKINVNGPCITKLCVQKQTEIH